jgi:5-methylcytosine-specific restriction protein B
MATREGIVKKDKKLELVQLMPKLFKNRQEAEFALDLIKETFSILKIDRSSKLRFPIHLDTSEPSISINLYEKKTCILSFEKLIHNASCKMEIMLWADLKGADEKYLYFNFDKREADLDFRIYKMSIESAISTKDDIYSNFFKVLANLDLTHKDKLSAVNQDKETEQKVLRDILLNAITDQKEREDLLQGIKNDKLNAEVYSLLQCSEDTGFDQKILEKWARSISRKGQAILYGPPGTGKTHMLSIWRSI